MFVQKHSWPLLRLGTPISSRAARRPTPIIAREVNRGATYFVWPSAMGQIEVCKVKIHFIVRGQESGRFAVGLLIRHVPLAVNYCGPPIVVWRHFPHSHRVMRLCERGYQS
jgi:hypothetical protein